MRLFFGSEEVGQKLKKQDIAKCRSELEPLHKPYLFKHIGEFSSLSGKTHQVT